MEINTKLFARLVELLVSENGIGHKKLEILVKEGKISEEEAELIKLSANTQLLVDQLDASF